MCMHAPERVDARAACLHRLRAANSTKVPRQGQRKKAGLGAAGGTPDNSKVLTAAGPCLREVPMAVLSRVGALGRGR